ncbi:aldehyde dehydrogenase family protein [candidate division WOR-3 bacterium]|nr:aldehyde dehydrogenase family protein [candidate division WOR-3 bacterium]
MNTAPKLLIAGKWVATGTFADVVNPYDRSVLGKVPVARAAEVTDALNAAEAGAGVMRSLPAHRRAQILHRTAELIAENGDEFVRLIVAEAGKPVKFARIEVSRAIETVRFSAEEAKRICGETVPMDALPGSERRRGFYIRVPRGVIAAITPFNFPLNLVVHKVAPALAAGNAVVLKPATKTPFCALKLAELLLQAGLPPEALNVLIGPGTSVGEMLVADPRVRMITFTGSAAVGEKIKKTAGLKPITLELGSNSGAIIDETAQLDRVVARCVLGAFAYSGQVCNHTQRLIVHQKVAPQFIEMFVAATSKLIIGDPQNPETDIGPLIDQVALERAETLIAEALSAGARLLTGGKAEGTIFLPTILTNVTPEMRVVNEETFAPIVTIETAPDFTRLLELYNRGSTAGKYAYGLCAGVFTSDFTRAFQAAEELEVGAVYINDSATFRVDHQPYGGVRDSGLGREGPKFAIQEMTEIRFVSFNLD